MESKRNIVKLNDEEIVRLGMEKSGDSFISKKYPIIISKNKSGEGYVVNWSFIAPQSIKEITPPPPITTNSDLIRIIITLSPILISEFKPTQLMSEEEAGKEIYEYAKSLVEFDDKDIVFYPNFSKDGFMYVPGNYKSLTLLTNYERKLKIVFDDESEEIIYTNPQAIGYKFIKDIFKKTPSKVIIYSKDENTEEPYFGISAFTN